MSVAVESLKAENDDTQLDPQAQKEGIKLFNTKTRSVEPLRPITPGEVKLYCCGPTVYNYQHIGNLRTYVFEDILVRTLASAGYEVRHVMNVTDVGHLVSDADEGEDKMALAAKREGKRSEELAEYYTKIFFDHCAALHIKKPDVVCKATDHIDQMIDLIARLLEKGFAYQSEGNVYFDVEQFERYGEFAKLDMSQLQAGARIDVDSNKKNPLDFALWFTNSKFENQELQWDSPWGRGYPGWHIECSAMAMHYLGETFDIHCGGIDHIPVHHTNEIAQSEAATGKDFAKVWMHGGFLVSGADKMSKSTGDFLTLDRLQEQDIDPIAYRLFCLSASYRSELSWSWEAIENSANALRRLKTAVLNLREECQENPSPKATQGLASLLEQNSVAETLHGAYFASCYHDLNMPKALATLHETLSSPALLAEEKLALLECYDVILGLGIAEWLPEQLPDEVRTLISQRDAARVARNWAEADAVRNTLQDMGYQVEDGPSGTRVRKH